MGRRTLGPRRSVWRVRSRRRYLRARPSERRCALEAVWCFHTCIKHCRINGMRCRLRPPPADVARLKRRTHDLLLVVAVCRCMLHARRGHEQRQRRHLLFALFFERAKLLLERAQTCRMVHGVRQQCLLHGQGHSVQRVAFACVCRDGSVLVGGRIAVVACWACPAVDRTAVSACNASTHLPSQRLGVLRSRVPRRKKSNEQL